MIQPVRLSLALSGLLVAVHLFSQPAAQNNTLRGRVLYQSSGNKPAAGVRIAEPDANPAYSIDNGDYILTFQQKRNGAALALEVGKDNNKGQKLELVNEKEVKAAKLPASAKEPLDIIVCPAGQRDIAAQKYYRILRTTADRELEKKKKEVAALLEQKEKDYQQISDLFALIDRMQAALDSAKIREQAFNIASINLDRASQMVKDAVKKIDEENDVEGALKILNAEALDTAYEHASAIKKQGETIVKKADAEIKQVIEGYEFKISLLEQQFQNGEIAVCYERIAEIYEKEGYDKEELASYYFMAGTYWDLHKDYNKAIEYDMKALSIREKILPADHPNLAETYSNLGFNYNGLSDFEKAAEFHIKALSIREKILPADHFDLTISYTGLAFAYYHFGEYQKALELDQKALAIREKILPADDPDLADLYNKISGVYLIHGNYQKALEFSHKALTIQEKKLSPVHPDLAGTFINLAGAYSYFGEYQKALELRLKALAIQEKILPPDHFDLIGTYIDLAAEYGNLGKYLNELTLSLKAAAIAEKNFSDEDPLLASIYNNLAAAYGNLGEYPKQLEYNLKSLTIREKILPADHFDLAVSFGNVATSYYNFRDYQKALEYELKALDIREKILPSDHFLLSQSYNNLAVDYGNLGEYPQQLEYCLKALAIREKILPANHPRLAISYSNTGKAYRDVGEYEKGIEYSQKAIRIGEASDPKHPGLNRFYANLGITYIKARRYSEAEAALEKSESLKVEYDAYKGWAMYYALQKKKKQAIESLQKAVSLGFKDLKWLESEPDLKNIRKEEGYKELMEQLKKG